MLSGAAKHGGLTTPIRFMATAGLREADKNIKEDRIESVKWLLGSIGFKDVETRIISGKDEAYFAWLTANYAMNKLYGHDQETYGVVELGGASVQIAFKKSKSPFNSKNDLIMGSAEACGKVKIVEQIKKSVKESVCFPEEESGVDFNACREAVLKTLASAKESDCTLAKFETEEDLTGKFAAVSNYYHTAAVVFNFDMDNKLSFKKNLNEFTKAAVTFCKLTWEEMKKKYSTEERKKKGTDIKEKHLKDHCLMAAYIDVVLEEGYGMDPQVELLFVDKYPIDENSTQQTELFGDSWTLGAAIDHWM